MISLFKNRSQKKEIISFIKHIKHVLVRDDDILSNDDKEKLKGLSSELKEFQSSVSSTSSDQLKTKLKSYKNQFEKVLPQKKWKLIREYAEIFIVALTVAFGVRALFIQPFKIPTSSMQPTLFGIHYVDKKIVPSLFQPLNFALYSTQRAELKTERAGTLEGFYPPFSRYFFPWTAFNIGGIKYELPGSKENVWNYLFKNGTKYNFKYGETACNGWLSQGDHLFVDRFTYHFIPPKRGDIVVFTTEGIKNDRTGESLTDHGFYYVKRLVGMPGDRLKIVDKMLFVKPENSSGYEPVTDFNIPAFNRIFSKKGGYQGYFPIGRLAKGKEVHVPENSYFMLGDNSFVSADGRYWGFVPRANIVGKALFVFWPLSRRWGLTDRAEPVGVPTTIEESGVIPAMSLQ